MAAAFAVEEKHRIEAKELISRYQTRSDQDIRARMMEGQLLKHCRCVKQWVKMAVVYPDLSDKELLQVYLTLYKIFVAVVECFPRHREYKKLENTLEVKEAKAEARNAAKLTNEVKPILQEKLAKAMAKRDEAARQQQVQEEEARQAQEQLRMQAMEAEARANVEAAVAKAAGVSVGTEPRPPVHDATSRSPGGGYMTHGTPASGGAHGGYLGGTSAATAFFSGSTPPSYEEAIAMPSLAGSRVSAGSAGGHGGVASVTSGGAVHSSATNLKTMGSASVAPRSMDELYAHALNVPSLSALPSARSLYEAEMNAPSERQRLLNGGMGAPARITAGGQSYPDEAPRPTRPPPVAPGGNWLGSSLSTDLDSLLRRVYLPGSLAAKFLQYAAANSAANRETCGILAGKLSGSDVRITHVLLPKQSGTSDSCAVTDAGEMDLLRYQDDRELLTLGWIHTHPSQTAFLSSVDLHTSYPYQLMLPEALAIVCSVKYQQTGVFRLTNTGMQEIGNCNERGFHPHNNADQLFEQSGHVTLEPYGDANIIDLR